MTLRIRKTFRLLPGLRINVSKAGVSASVGVPGTGVSYVVPVTAAVAAQGAAVALPLVVRLVSLVAGLLAVLFVIACAAGVVMLII